MRTLLEKWFVNKPHKRGRVVRWACKPTISDVPACVARRHWYLIPIANNGCLAPVGKPQGISRLGLSPLDTRVIKNGLLIAEPISPKLKDGGDIPIYLLYETHVTLSCLHHCLTFLFLILKL